MSVADIIIVIVVSLIAISIIFFYFIFPHFKNRKNKHCASCPMGEDKKIKRAFRDYHKNKK